MSEIVIAGLGQSNLWRWWNRTVSPATPHTSTFMWDVTTASWVTPVGDALIEFLNNIATETGQAVYFYPGAVGGTKLYAHWLSEDPGSPLSNLKDMITAGAKTPKWFLLDLGESNSHNPEASFSQGLSILYGKLLQHIANPNPTAKFLLTLTGRFVAGGDAGISTIRNEQLQFAQTPNAYLAASRMDVEYESDGIHVATSASGSIRYAKRAARTLCTLAGFGETTGVGPQIASFSRNGRVLTLYIEGQNLSMGCPNRTQNLTGFEVSSDDFSTILPIEISYIAGAKAIVIVLASDPGIPVKLRYQYGLNPDVTNAVSAGLNPFGDTRGLPLLPTIGAIEESVVTL